jgi:hypothetical protein
MPTNWQTTYSIHRQNPACGRQARQESGGAGGVGLSPCHQPVQPAVFPEYYESVLRTEQVVQRGAKIGPRFSSESIYAGNSNLENYLISSLNDNCKRKKTPENGYLDSFRLV